MWRMQASLARSRKSLLDNTTSSAPLLTRHMLGWSGYSIWLTPCQARHGIPIVLHCVDLAAEIRDRHCLTWSLTTLFKEYLSERRYFCIPGGDRFPSFTSCKETNGISLDCIVSKSVSLFFPFWFGWKWITFVLPNMVYKCVFEWYSFVLRWSHAADGMLKPKN